MGDEGAAGEQERMICKAGAAIGALPCVLRLTVTPRHDGRRRSPRDNTDSPGDRLFFMDARNQPNDPRSWRTDRRLGACLPVECAHALRSASAWPQAHQPQQARTSPACAGLTRSRPNGLCGSLVHVSRGCTPACPGWVLACGRTRRCVSGSARSRGRPAGAARGCPRGLRRWCR